ncbi:transcription elongation factor spt4 [Didymella pomorum]
MPPKKGLATTKKVDKYVYVNEDTDSETSAVSDTESSKTNALLEAKRSSAKQSNKNSAFLDDSVKENIDPNDLRGIPKRSNPIEPCQDSQSFNAPRTRSHLDQHSAPSTQKPARTSKSRGSKLRSKNLDSITSDSNEQLHLPSDPPFHQPFAKMTTMIPGGAFVPPNQQRNLRACMVCSIVRTYTQFMNGGCPNCEEILELAGNSENVNDCTSQVFEGLITVADTSKSWVARYQRLEGYVAGVYATQVEGILPEEIISAIEAAGINYVPRDGSEDQMIPKD